ncbi:MAG: gliding motility-associated C-terminal domain-containing protein [Bacteroidales bacterium]|jgi:gliding motility-associated-like protein|nr:gliding motility-associated C-terminal domain-containing protein [Bacteroidales bacterium]
MRKTVHFVGGLIFVALLFAGYSAKSQLFYNNGANVHATEGALVFVDGIVQNQSGQIEVEENAGNNAEFIIQDDFINNSTAGGDGYYRVLGDWVNNNTFNAGTGTIFLEGGNQLLDGTVSTTFNNLTLDGTGLKTQTIDQFCVGILDLKSLELQNETHGFFVQNTDVNAIIRTTGFVSALDGGFLSRQTNTAAIYLFPVGSSVGTLRYRPVELTPENATANTYTVRMANVLATGEGYDITALPPKICEVNPEFYHQIDRTAGTAASNINVFYDETEDGAWDGLASWTTTPDLWDIILGTVITPGAPFNEAFVSTWNNFIELPYILYIVQPEANITDPGAFCVNDAALDLTAVDPGGTWSGTGITDATNGTFNPATASTGTHTITYDIGTGSCTATDQIDITVNPIPDATITDPGDFCANDAAVNLSAATAGGTWTGDGITDAVNGTFDPTTANIGANNITYEVTAAGCTGTDNITIQVNALPNVNAGADFAVCEGEDINLTETGGDAILWDWAGPGTYSAAIQNPIILSATAANAGTYTVEIEDANGCIATDDVALTVDALPDATITDPGDFCANDAAVNLSAATPGGTWTGDGITDAVNGTFDPVTAIIGANSVTYEVTIGTCTGTDNINIQVNATPNVNAGADIDICEGEDINLTETGGDAILWDWTGPGTYSAGIQNPTILSATAVDAGTYTVEVEDANGCIATDDVAVTVNALPVVPTNDVDCSGGTDAGIITVTSPLGANYEYSIDGVNFQAGTSFGPLTNGSYTITVEDITSGCTTTGGNINLDCGCATPTDLVLTALSGNTCVETAFSQSGNTFGGSATEVNLAHDGDGSLNALNFTSSPFEFIYTPAVTDVGNTISITVTTDNPFGAPCSVAQETFTLTVRNIPLVNANSNSPVCDGTDIELSETGGAANTWTWTGPGTFSPDANAQNPDIINATAADAGVYTVVITDAFGCTATDDVTVAINPSPAVNAGADFAVCEGDDINLSETGGDANVWTWTGPGTFTPDANAQNPVVGNAIAANAGTYTVEIEDVNGCIATDDVAVSVNATPDATITDPGDFCANDAAINLTATTLGGTWTGDGITDGVNGTFDPTSANIGANNITYEVTAAGCTGTDNITIQVNALPNVNAGADFAVCEGDDINLTETGGDATIWNWTGPGTYSAGIQNPTILSATATDAGTYTVEVEDANGCIATDDVAVTVNATPDPTITDPGDFCSDDAAFDLSAATGGGNWTGDGITDATNGTFNPAAANIGVNNITYEVTVSGCTGTDNITIDIFDTPDATITDPGDFCSDDAAMNLSAGTTGGTWSGTGITDATNGTFDPSSVTPGTYTITYNVGTGTCSDVDQIDITVNATPDATITDPGDFCSDDAAFDLSAATGGGTWTGDGITNTTNGTFDPSLAIIGTNNITYEVTIAGCTGTDNITIDVFDTPDATITDPGDFCSNDAAMDLGAASTGGTWSGTGITDATNGTFDPSSVTPGTYTITYNVGTGTCSDSDQIDITVNATPDATITDPGDFCSDDAAFDLSAATGSGNWTGDGITDATNGTFDPSAANIGVNNITYEVTVAGCTGTDNITINISETPDATITDPGLICITDAAFNLDAVSGGGLWAGNGITDNNAGIFDPSVAGVGIHLITYQVINGSCNDSDQINIEVINTPDASITPAGPFCQNDPAVSLQAATPGGTWTGPGITNEASGTFNPSQANLGDNVITYTVSIGACSASSQTTIQVLESENASITPVGPYCYGEFTVQLEVENYGGNWLSAHVDNNGVFNVESAGAGTHTVIYTIPGGCGDSDTINIVIHPANFVVDYSLHRPSCFGGDNASVEFAVLGGTPPYSYFWSTASSDTSYVDGLTAGVYQFTISDVNGCEVNVETINIFDGSRDCLRIPNAFTPNDDGINDNFIIENLEFYPNSKLQIFNRWGQLLYEGGPNEEPWDGTYNGNPVPTGSYIYVLALRSELEDVVGVVTLVR